MKTPSLGIFIITALSAVLLIMSSVQLPQPQPAAQGSQLTVDDPDPYPELKEWEVTVPLEPIDTALVSFLMDVNGFDLPLPYVEALIMQGSIYTPSDLLDFVDMPLTNFVR